MSIVKVEARTGLGMLLTLTLGDASNGYVVEDIDGLGPVKSTITSSTFVNLPGGRIQASRREMRNILLKLKLEPNYATQSVFALRQHLYSFFMTDIDVDLRIFMESGLTVDTSGRVESCEPALFTDEPRIDVSILCEDPDFLGLTPVVIDSHETVEDLDEWTLHYEGTSLTGIEFVLNLDRSLTEFTIHQRPPDNILRTLDFAASMVDNDILTINTVPGEKSITLTRTGVDTSLLYGKTPQSKWITLMPGDNHIRVHAEGAAIPYTITYTPRYGGL
jgi:hypothetical protein